VSTACATAALLLVILYFVGYQRPPHHPPSPGIRATLGHSLRCLAVGFGPGVERLWPYSGAVVPALLLAGAGLLLARSLRDPRERGRAAGLICLLGAVGCVVLGVGWARAGFGPQQAFESRYSVFSIPLICSILLYWDLGSNRGPAEFIMMSIFSYLCLLLPLNDMSGKQRGEYMHAVLHNFERDLRHGASAPELARRHGKFIFASNREQELSRLFLELRRAGISKFRSMQDGSACREVPIPVVPDQVHEVTWDHGTAQGTGSDPFLVFALSRPRFINSVVIRYSHENGSGTPAVFQAFWKVQGRQEFTPGERSVTLDLQTGRNRVLVIPVYDRLDRFRIDPDIVPCRFHIDRISMRVPNRLEGGPPLMDVPLVLPDEANHADGHGAPDGPGGDRSGPTLRRGSRESARGTERRSAS
jgi:hypothetical protein